MDWQLSGGNSPAVRECSPLLTRSPRCLSLPLPLSPYRFKTCGTHFSLFRFPLLSSSHLTFSLSFFFFYKQTPWTTAAATVENQHPPTPTPPTLFFPLFLVCVSSPLIPPHPPFSTFIPPPPLFEISGMGTTRQAFGAKVKGKGVEGRTERERRGEERGGAPPWKKGREEKG